MVVESAKSLATWRKLGLGLYGGRGGTHLSYPSDVLFPVFGREAQVFVQAETDVIAVESVACQALLEKMLLESDRYGGFSRGRQAGEPDCAAPLLAQLAAFLAGEAGVPGDVAVAMSDHGGEGGGGGGERRWSTDVDMLLVSLAVY